jgi:hypothetical protein
VKKYGRRNRSGLIEKEKENKDSVNVEIKNETTRRQLKAGPDVVLLQSGRPRHQ